MGICVFKTSDLRRCAEHALKATKWRMGFSSRRPEPGLLLAHDQGVYIMSNGIPADVDIAKEQCHLVYAKRCNPDKDEDWYQNSRELVGGDDFGEVLAIPPDFLRMCDKFPEMSVEITEKEIKCWMSDSGAS
jgi:hypothetical protein